MPGICEAIASIKQNIVIQAEKSDKWDLLMHIIIVGVEFLLISAKVEGKSFNT